MSIEEDSSIALEAEIIGNPYPEVKWYKDYQLIMAGEGLDIKSKDTQHLLTIAGTEKEDSGIYMIAATNIAGLSFFLYAD